MQKITVQEKPVASPPFLVSPSNPRLQASSLHCEDISKRSIFLIIVN